MTRIMVPTLKDLTQHDLKILDKPEIRVWCHPHYIKKEGSDYFYKFESVQEAEIFIKSHKEAENKILFAFNGYEYDLFATKIEEEENGSKDKL